MSTTSPFTLMQRAVDIVEASAHPTNKVAATLHVIDALGNEIILSRTNYWPAPLQEHFDEKDRIGNSSATIHAETACLIEARTSNNGTLYVTDLPCPNCVKNMAEAGIKTLYIDHKGFHKDYARRRGHYFENMSLKICEKAAINVFKIFRKEERIEPIIKTKENYTPAIENPSHIATLHEEITDKLFERLIKEETLRYKNKPFALALSYSTHGRPVMVSTVRHPVTGFTSRGLEQSGESDKYSFMLEPINRILMADSRFGLLIENGYLFSSRTPTARELVNMIGAKLTTLTIADQTRSRDQFGPQALQQLLDKNIITLTPFPFPQENNNKG